MAEHPPESEPADVTQAQLASEIGAALPAEGRRRAARSRAQRARDRRAEDGPDTPGDPRAPTGDGEPERRRRGAHNEIAYYNRSEGGPQEDSGGTEAPGPVSRPP